MIIPKTMLGLMTLRLLPGETVMAYDVSPDKGGSYSLRIEPVDLSTLPYNGWQPKDLGRGRFTIMTNKRMLSMLSTGAVFEEELPPFFTYSVLYAQGTAFKVSETKAFIESHR